MSDLTDLTSSVERCLETAYERLKAEFDLIVARQGDYGPVTPCGRHPAWYDNSSIAGSRWISDRANAHENSVPERDVTHYRKDFFSTTERHVTVAVAADDRLEALSLNNEPLTTGSVSSGTLSTRTAVVRKGWNVLQAEVANRGSGLNPSGFFCYVEELDSEVVLLVTDGSWSKRSEPSDRPYSLYVNGSTDVVTFDWHPGTVLYSDKPFAYELEYRFEGIDLPSSYNAPILTLGRIHNDPNQTVLNQGVDLWARSTEGVLAIHISGSSAWEEGEQTDLMRITTLPDTPSFINALDGQWHVIRVEYDGSETPEGVSVFIDGVQQATESSRRDAPIFNDKVLTSPGAPIRLSRGTALDLETGELIPHLRSTLGSFRDIKLWSDSELVLWAAFNEGSGTVVHDYSKYSNHSTPFTGALWVDESDE